MGTQIAEPNQVTAGTLRPETAQNFAIICYEKSQTEAGLKKLELVEWVDFLNYNGYKADNIAKIVGISTDEYDYKHLIPDVAVDDTIRGQLDNLAAQAGLTLTHPAPAFVTHEDRISQLEDWVDKGWTDPEDPEKTIPGLLDRTSVNEDDISAIKAELGNAPAGEETLFDRMNTAENNISNLQTTVGSNVEGEKTGLCGKVETLEHDVDGYFDIPQNKYIPGLKDKVDGWTDPDSSTHYDGIETRLQNVEGTVGDSTTPDTIVYDVNKLKTDVNTVTGRVDNLDDVVITGENPLIDRVTNLEGVVKGVYKIKGNATRSDIDNWNSNKNEWKNFENGYVYNVVCNDNETLNIEIPLKDGGIENLPVTNGSNIVFIEETSTYKYGYFDDLGSIVVDKRVETLDENVGTRPDEFTGTLFDNVDNLNENVGTKPDEFTGTLFDTVYRSYSEFTSTTETGTFFTTGINAAGNRFAFIIPFNNGITTESIIISLSTVTFADCFSINSGKITLLQGFSSKVNLVKIGE